MISKLLNSDKQVRLSSLNVLMTLIYTFISIFHFFSFADEPVQLVKQHSPKQITKNGAVTVPEGMHIITDRTGTRWLLPLSMSVPPERELSIAYYRAKTTPKAISQIGTHEVWDTAFSAEATVVSENINDKKNLMQRLPKAFSELLYLEKAANIHANTSSDLLSLGNFTSSKFVTFKIPYIPVPATDFEFAHISDYATDETKKLLEFYIDGRKYYRFFIHPNYVHAYEDMINKFGIVYHYDAMTTSSPRSLIVQDPEKPNEVHWIKVSLHKKIDGSVRINTDKKARRAIIMSEAINEVPKEALENYRLSFMLEPASFQPKGKIASTIHREVSRDLLNPGEGYKWIPAFILQNTGPDAVPELNLFDMIRSSQLSPEVFIDQKIVRPLLRAYLSMGIIEGLPGELHTQNFYYKLERTKNGWMPTGDVMFKDNDGFRYDTELALRKKRGMQFFSKFDEPFVWGKFSNTLGLGAEGIPFLGSWYYKLIRNVNGFETLSAYMLRALQQIEPSAGWSKDRIQYVFDSIAATEAERLTGVSLDPQDYGFAKDKGLNRVLGIYRAQLSGSTDTTQRYDLNLQALLMSEWSRLKAEKRVSALRRSVSKDVYFLLHEMSDGALVIEARTPKTSIENPDPTIGFAILESANHQMTENFKHKVGKYLKPNANISCKGLFY